MKIAPAYDFRFGLVKCSTCTIPQLLDEIRSLVSNKAETPRTINCLNAYIYNLAYKMPDLKMILNESRVVAADGMSIAWAARMFRGRIPERCNMTETFRAFLVDGQMPASRAVMIGCAQHEVDAAVVEVEQLSSHCRIISGISGFLNEEEYRVILASHSNVDFIFVGMGSPKSEKMVKLAEEICPRAVVWHIGGGTIKFLAGTAKEAPSAWRRSGFQWLFRLCQDPRLMWRRYLMGIPLFVCRILMDAIRQRFGRQR
jgi:N-acetylglucosaminyldiphosphoundecaprenol N-acetyl-beta-D-mannosaminyltransferase